MQVGGYLFGGGRVAILEFPGDRVTGGDVQVLRIALEWGQLW